MRFLTLVCVLLFFSCNKKTVQLPEISHSEITEITDLSPAYIFYDETQPDSVELNRKNLIISTNWVVNVDKRLTLGQAIPKVQILQAKRRNATMHKNETAKDYYSCNDASIKSLGFIDFTDIIYETSLDNGTLPYSDTPTEVLVVKFLSLENIEIDYIYGWPSQTISSDFSNLLRFLESYKDITIKLCFNSNISFQDYITVKSEIITRISDDIHLFNYELIYN